MVDIRRKFDKSAANTIALGQLLGIETIVAAMDPDDGHVVVTDKTFASSGSLLRTVITDSFFNGTNMFPMYQGLTNLFPSEAVFGSASNGVPHRAEFLQCYVNNLVELFGIPSDDSIPEVLKKSFDATRRLSLDKLVAVIRLYITLGYKTDLGIQKYLDTVSPRDSNGIFWSSQDPPLGIKKFLLTSKDGRKTANLAAKVVQLSEINNKSNEIV
jgi:hypothetical protein